MNPQEASEKPNYTSKKSRKSQVSGSDAKPDEKSNSKWQTTVKRGIPSFADFISLKDLVESRIPLLETLKLSPLNSDNIPPLSDFPYPYHTASAQSLRATINTLINPELLQHIAKVPLMSSGLIMLASPYEGSEIYLRKLLETILAETQRHLQEKGTNQILYTSISNHDLFPRLSGHEIVSAPPLKPSSLGQGGMPVSVKGGGRRPNKGGGTTIGSFGLVVEVQRSQFNNPDEEILDEDVPQIPYPWGKNYLTPSGHLMPLMQNRIQPENFKTFEAQELVSNTLENLFKSLSSQSNGRPVVVFYEDLKSLLEAPNLNARQLAATLHSCIANARRKCPLVIIAPATPTFKHSIPKDGRPVSGIAALLHQISNDLDESNDNSKSSSGGPSVPGHPGNDGSPESQAGGIASVSRRKSTRLRFETPLDDVLGVATIPIYPPVQDGVLAVKKFKHMMRRDRRQIYRQANLREIEVIWNALSGAASKATKPTFLAFNDNAVIAALQSGSVEPLPGAQNKMGRSILEHRLLSPVEIERLVTYIVGEMATRVSSLVNSQPYALSPEDVSAGMKLFASNLTAASSVQAGIEFAGIFANPRDVLTLSSHEQKLLHHCLLKPEKMSTTFGSIGGLAQTKQVINELIRLPLLRPDLFSFGVLKQSTTGILLFGPPGTGKTMLARAVAAESGANFLNVQMSNVQSMWVGENEKNVKALFTLARKLRPCVIFVDEIDALLRVRQRSQPSWVTNTINEWMLEWDGIQSENGQGVIVVGATNRPFDLDEAVLRRLPRRIMVDLPGLNERLEILDILLREEKVLYSKEEALDPSDSRKRTLSELAKATDGYSGSDLKNLCIAAALRAVRSSYANIFVSSSDKNAEKERIITKNDFMSAIHSGEVVPSLNDKNELLQQLNEWNKTYGTASGGYNRNTSGWGFSL
ncbi:hypothetical protein HDU97_003644 [Phlyctochytrium planicorne]|nr:hypothetical protein HDU97_003644 [Phlyctochytrium planicorne]